MAVATESAPVVQAGVEAVTQSQTDKLVGKIDFPVGNEFADVNVVWSGEWGDALEKAMAKPTASVVASEPKAEESAAQAADPSVTSTQNPAASSQEPNAVVADPESESVFNLDSLTEDDFSKVLESPTAKRMLGPKYQSERDKSYTRGVEAGRAQVEQEVTIARAAKNIEFDDTAKSQAQQALTYARSQTAQVFIRNLEDSLGSLAERYGMERELASLNGKQFGNMHEYLNQVVEKIIEPVITDRSKREATKLAKDMAKATTVKQGEARVAAIPKTPDFIPSSVNPSGAHNLNTPEGAAKAYNAGEISTHQYAKLRRDLGID